MSVRLRVDGNSGKVAIYDYTAENDVPFSSPLSAVSRLRFHSELIYPHIIYTRTVSVKLPEVIANAKNDSDTTYTANLFAHGQSGIPWVEGKVTAGLGSIVPLCGSVPVQQHSSSPSSASQSFVRILHLGADSTNVVLNSFCVTEDVQTMPELTITVVAYVTNILLT
jgi:hypothetical protein